MALMSSEIIIRHELRPCEVLTSDHKWRKALFHQWITESEIVPPAVYVGGHPGGVVSGAFAIVEMEDGRVRRVDPASVRFLDHAMCECVFLEDKK